MHVECCGHTKTSEHRGAAFSLTIALTLTAQVASGQASARSIAFFVHDRTTLEPLLGATLIADHAVDLGYTDSLGVARTTLLGEGQHTLMVKRLGYRDADLRIHIVPASDTIRIEMDAVAAPLRSVNVEATNTPSHLRDFERRRNTVVQGLFLGRAQLDSLKNQSLPEILRSRARGGRIVADLSAGGAEYLVSTRPRMDGAVRIEPGTKRTQRDDLCVAQVVVDQAIVYMQGPPGSPGPAPFDLRSLPVSQIDALEYYANDAVTPAEFKRGPAVCGTLVITLRQR